MSFFSSTIDFCAVFGVFSGLFEQIDLNVVIVLIQHLLMFMIE